jgi:hypothetical protein
VNVLQLTLLAMATTRASEGAGEAEQPSQIRSDDH